MDTLHERLSIAVDWWFADQEDPGRTGATRLFQERMEARLAEQGGKAGRTYRAILTYLNGESEPSLAWLREASEVLGVRLGWLVSGDGQPNQAWDDLAGQFAAALRDGLSGLGPALASQLGLRELPDGLPRAINRVAMDIARATDRGRPAIMPFFGEVGEALLSPLTVSGVDVEALPGGALEHYLTVTAEELHHLLATAGFGRAKHRSETE